MTTKIKAGGHLRIEPASDGIAEEDEVGDDSSRVDADHLAHPAERRVLLVIVPDVPGKKE